MSGYIDSTVLYFLYCGLCDVCMYAYAILHTVLYSRCVFLSMYLCSTLLSLSMFILIKGALCLLMPSFGSMCGYISVFSALMGQTDVCTYTVYASKDSFIGWTDVYIVTALYCTKTDLHA